jgi:hypothetical protein
MIITTASGRSIDTQLDLTAPERHVLQKLFAWEMMANGIEQFREKKEEALQKGWNNSGPINESKAFKIVVKHLEQKIKKRLETKSASDSRI